MKSMFKKASRVGRKAVKFNLFVKVFNVALLDKCRPKTLTKNEKVFVELERGSRTDKTKVHELDEPMWDDAAVQVPVTLYRDAKGKYQPKAFTLMLKQGKDQGLLATFVVDASQFASVGQTATSTLKLAPVKSKSKVKDVILRVTVGCTFLKEVGDDDASTVMTDLSVGIDQDLSGFDAGGGGSDGGGGGGGSGTGSGAGGGGNVNDEQGLEGFEDLLEEPIDEDAHERGAHQNPVQEVADNGLAAEAAGARPLEVLDEEEESDNPKEYDEASIDALLNDVDTLIVPSDEPTAPIEPSKETETPPLSKRLSTKSAENGRVGDGAALGDAENIIALLQTLNDGGHPTSAVNDQVIDTEDDDDGEEVEKIRGKLNGELSMAEAEAESLRKQKQQAAIKELFEELQLAQNQNVVLEEKLKSAEEKIVDLASVARTVKTRCKEVEKSLGIARADVSAAQSEAEAKSALATRLQEMLSAKEVEFGDQGSSLALITAKLATMESRVTEAEKALANATSEADIARQTEARNLANMKSQLVSAEAKMDEMEADNEAKSRAATSNISKLNREIEDLTNTVKNMEEHEKKMKQQHATTISEMKTQEEEYEARLLKAENSLAEVKAQSRQALADSRSQFEHQIAEIEAGQGADSASNASALATAQSKCSALTEQVETLTAKIEEMEKTSAAAQRKSAHELTAAKDRALELEEELSSLKESTTAKHQTSLSRITTLESQNEALQEELDTAKHAIAAAERRIASETSKHEAAVEQMITEKTQAIALLNETHESKMQLEATKLNSLETKLKASEAEVAEQRSLLSAAVEKSTKEKAELVSKLAMAESKLVDMTSGEAQELTQVQQQLQDELQEEQDRHAETKEELEDTLRALADLRVVAAEGLQAAEQAAEEKQAQQSSEIMALYNKLNSHLTATSERDEKHSEANEILQAQLEEKIAQIENVQKELEKQKTLLVEKDRLLVESQSTAKSVYGDLEEKLQKTELELKEANRAIEEFSANTDTSARESANTSLQLAKQQREADIQIKTLLEEVEGLKASSVTSAQAHTQAMAQCEELKAKSEANEKLLVKFRKALTSIKTQVEASFKQHHASSARRSVSTHVNDGDDEDQATTVVELLSEYLHVASSAHTDFHRTSALLSEQDEKSSSYHQTSLKSEERCKQLEEEKKQLVESQEKEVKLMKKQIDKLKREILEVGEETEPLEIEISELKSKLMMDEMNHVEVLSKLKKEHQEEIQQLRLEMRAVSASASMPDQGTTLVSSSSKLAELEKKLGESEATLRDNQAALHFTSQQTASLKESSAQQLDQVTRQEPVVVRNPPSVPPPTENIARCKDCGEPVSVSDSFAHECNSKAPPPKSRFSMFS